MELATVLGLLQQDVSQEVTEIAPEIQALIDERQAARKEKTSSEQTKYGISSKQGASL